ncbi:Gag-Pol polyprotein, partial [Nosema granulosis]
RDGNERRNTKNKVIVTEYPNQLWEVDLVGKINEREGSKFIFVAIDHYTKWIETKVLVRKTSEEIYKAVEELIIRKHGIPERILSDNGLEFNNKTVQSLQEKYNFTWEFGSPYHHQTTGAVERVIQTLRTRLRRITDFGRREWSPQLAKATLAYNLSFNRAIKTSPYIFKYGTQKELCIDATLGRRPKSHSKQDLIDERNRNMERYKESIIKGKKCIARDIKIGEKVLIFRETGLEDKMIEKWWPGYIVTDLVGEDAYLVRKINENTFLRVNKRHIKKDTTLSS